MSIHYGRAAWAVSIPRKSRSAGPVHRDRPGIARAVTVNETVCTTTPW